MKLAPIRSTALTFATLLLAASAAPPKAESTTARAADAEFLKESKQAKSTDATEQAAYEAWFGKYRLDLNDPKMLDADADGDGASNRDEFLADTNPRNASSHPPTGAAQAPLRFTEYNEGKLPLVLESVRGGKAVIKNGDPIVIDAEKRAITLDIGAKELDARLRQWKQPKPNYRRGVLAKYAALVSSASEGAVTDRQF